jgi:hypothetical protein
VGDGDTVRVDEVAGNSFSLLRGLGFVGWLGVQGVG